MGGGCVCGGGGVCGGVCGRARGCVCVWVGVGVPTSSCEQRRSPLRQVRFAGHKDEAIEFHWDVDEELACDQGLHITPHISTVTYVSLHDSPQTFGEVGFSVPRRSDLNADCRSCDL